MNNKYVGYWATFITLTSYIFLANKINVGWIIAIISSLFWILYSYRLNDKAILLTNIGLLCCFIYGMVKWI